MAVRIQFRRGTAAEWTSANPTLVAGELGYETDTTKFKIGDGSTAWTALGYGGISQGDIDNAVANVIDLAPGSLDTLNELAASIGDDPDFINTISTSIADEKANAFAYTDEQTALTQSNAQSYTNSAIANLIDSSPGTLDTLNELAAALGDDPNFSTTITNSLANRVQFVTDTAANFDSANPTLAAQQLAITSDSKRIKVGDGVLDWANVNYVGEDLVLIHNQDTAVHGISNTLNLIYQDDLDAVESSLQTNINNVDTDLQNAKNNLANVSAQSSNTVSDLANTDNRVTTLEGTTLDQGNAIDALESTTETQGNTLTTLTASVSTLGDDVNTLDNRIDTLDTTVTTLAPLTSAQLTSPTITGATLDGATTLEVGATLEGLSPTELGYLSGVTSGVQSQIDAKADIDAPTFTGNVVLPATTSIGDVTGIELGYLENVSANIQLQLDAKLATDSAASIYAPLSGPTFAGTVSLPATTSIGGVSSVELGHVNGVTSGIQGQLDVKATLESPVFTGTVSGVTASMVGLSNVDNTSDADKAVSIAAQAALDSKLDLVGGIMTGKITLDGDPTQALHAVTKQYADSISEGLHIHAAVVALSDSNIDLTGATPTTVIDGVTLVDGDRVIVNGQTLPEQNGIYNYVAADSSFARALDFDEPGEVAGGDFVFVTGGTDYENTGWVKTSDSVSVIGTDAINFTQFSGAGSVTAGSNIDVTGTQVSVVAAPIFTDKVTLSANGIQFSDGTIQTEAGVPSLTEFTEKTTSYQLDTLAHKDNVVEMNSAAAVTFTIPLGSTLSWPVGASMDILQTGAGQVTIAIEAGGTLNFTPGNKLRTQYSSCTIMKRGIDSWILFGDLTA